MNNEEKDRHVLAAAIYSGANHLVTLNTKHFPKETAHGTELRIVTPDEFLLEFTKSEDGMLSLNIAFAQQIKRLRRHTFSSDALLKKLAISAPQFADWLRATQGTFYHFAEFDH